jgi:antitoxin VapB
MDIDLEITRVGDVITIFPARNSLKAVVAELRRMPKPPCVKERYRSKCPCAGTDAVARSWAN